MDAKISLRSFCRLVSCFASVVVSFNLYLVSGISFLSWAYSLPVKNEAKIISKLTAKICFININQGH